MMRMLPRFRFASALLLLVLGSSVLAQPASEQAARDWPAYTGISQVALQVMDLERSRDFYTRLFGSEVWRQGLILQKACQMRGIVTTWLETNVGGAGLGMRQQGQHTIA